MQVMEPTLGQILKAARLKSGQTQSDLGLTLDVSTPFVSDVELGKRSITAELAKKWCDALGLSVAQIARLSGRLPYDMTQWLLAEEGRIEKVIAMMKRGTKVVK